MPPPRPKKRPAERRSSPVADDVNADKDDDMLPFIRRSLSTLAVAAWLPRIGVHVRANYEDPEAPSQVMLTPTNAALRTQTATLDDIDQQIRNSSLCHLRFTFEPPLVPYTQCFTPITWPTLSSPSSATAAADTTTATTATATFTTPQTLDHWRFYQLLRAAAKGAVPLIYRRHVTTYAQLMLVAGKTMGSWLHHGASIKRTTATRDVFDLYHSGVLVTRETIDRLLSIYQRACGYPATGSSRFAAQQHQQPSCVFTAEDVALLHQETASTTVGGGWVMPVDVLLVSDDASLLIAVERRYHWLTFPVGISQDAVYDRVKQRHFTHVGTALRSSSSTSYFSTRPVQASLEVLRDVYYLTHACTVLIGSASSQVFRTAVSMSGAIGRVAEVRWFETTAEQRTWKLRAEQIAMPFPEIS